MLNLRVGNSPLGKVLFHAAFGAVLLAMPSQSGAQDRSARDRDKPRTIPNYHVLTDTPRRNTTEQNFVFSVSVKGKGRVLWAGDLSLAEYNGARIETDLQDVNPSCGLDNRRISSRSNALVLSLAPVDLSEGYRFRLKAHWTHRLPSCDEMRTETQWLNVPIEIAEGETKVVSGDGDFEVKLTRKAWPKSSVVDR